jgi:hypothetical protein
MQIRTFFSSRQRASFLSRLPARASPSSHGAG